jgi:hypothetical protein
VKDPIGNINLLHVLYQGTCTDPDCELHNPEVGYAEEVVTKTDMAFFYAGAVTLADLLRGYLPQSPDEPAVVLTAKLMDDALAEVRDAHMRIPD